MTIRAHAEDDRGVRIDVLDNGDGIDAESCEVIFDKFYHEGPSTPERPRGTGLGLAICRQIVTAFGGIIRAVPNVTDGACISVTLPAAGGSATGLNGETAR